MGKIKIAVLGLGTVGTGVVKGINRHKQKLEVSLGKEIEIRKVLVRNAQKKRDVDLSPGSLTTFIDDVYIEPDLDAVIEVMGGVHPTYSYVKEFLSKGIHVITANKALIALYGPELTRLARDNGAQLLYEASVGAAIPVIHTLKHCMRVNEISKISGILNGTTNYILTQMLERNCSYESILKEAQALGYAEADPSSDVEGFDAANKLTILCRLCFGDSPLPGEIKREGITNITNEELQLVNKLGYKIKLIATAEQVNGKLLTDISPTLLPLEHPLSSVDDVLNAVSITADLAGELTFIGKGAGELPTASAILEDLYSILQFPMETWNPSYHRKIELLHDVGLETAWFLHFNSTLSDNAQDLAQLTYLLNRQQLLVNQTTQVSIDTDLISNGLIIESSTPQTIELLKRQFSRVVTARKIEGNVKVHEHAIFSS
jgi:homoserine dehydrogenase